MQHKMRQIIFVLLATAGFANAGWLRRGRSDQPKETSFVGEATNELSTALLQGYINDDENIVFSPLGYSVILAILAEGARGETRNQLVTALHLPDDPNVTRKTFRYIMERLKFRNEYESNQPEFKNYFYIYKNYTINDEYKKILEDYYLTEVRSVEQYTDKLDDDHDKDDEKVKKGNGKSEELSKIMPPKETYEKLITFTVDDKPEKVDVSKFEYKPAKNIKEKIKLVKTNQKKEEFGDEEETMVAVEARNHARSLRLTQVKDDITASISINGIGKKSTKTTSPLMLLFNGMYFRGSWSKPFDTIEPGIFYKSNTEKKLVLIMKTRGTFKTALLPDLDSEAILLPYDGGRYALLVVTPRSRDGLTRLIADLPAAPIPEILESLRDEEVDVFIPTYNVETTTKPIAALAQFGVSSIFRREADLSGVSAKEGLFVQELEQNVAVRVVNPGTKFSLIGASNGVAESKNNQPLYESKAPRRFCVEHPFLFFIVDRLDNLVVVSGKITDPQLPPDY